MHWKQQVQLLEQEASFDIAIFLLEKVVKNNPNDVDAYIFLLFRLREMWLEGSVYWCNVSKDPLRDVKKEYYASKRDNYMAAAEKYFAESYHRFSENPEYLYYAAHILGHIAWYFGASDDLQSDLELRAVRMRYNAVLNMIDYYKELYDKEPNNVDVIKYAASIVNDPSLQEQLATKGAAAEYVIGGEVSWAKKILEDAHKDKAESK
ncbi:hypothetical protein JST99_03205 [Candidatus Dependentiae bacterium]|nr:hypothetical protein [Candidatus Dependentiae bacterium]MCC7414989.1 hypothetical protein [Campylobacterota bacterium]